MGPVTIKYQEFSRTVAAHVQPQQTQSFWLVSVTPAQQLDAPGGPHNGTAKRGFAARSFRTAFTAAASCRHSVSALSDCFRCHLRLLASNTAVAIEGKSRRGVPLLTRGPVEYEPFDMSSPPRIPMPPLPRGGP